MEIYKKALVTALQVSIYQEVAMIILIVIALVMIRKFIKHDYFPKWVFWIYTAIFTTILAVSSIPGIKIVLDLNNDAYVTYYGRYNQIVEGYDLYQTTVLLDGKKIRLASKYSISVKGEHTGFVVYSEKSRIAVYVGEKLPESIPKPLPQIPQEE